MRKIVHLGDGHPATVRVDTADEHTVGIVRGYRNLLSISSGDVVLDLGAHIGLFTRLAVSSGAGRVVAVEPDAENLSVLAENVEPIRDSVTIVAAAAVTSKAVRESKTVKFYLASPFATDSHSLYIRQGRVGVDVPAVSFHALMAQWQPSLVKIDVEGAEYDLLLEGPLPDSVRGVVAEFHLNRTAWRERQAPDVVECLSGQGFQSVRAPTLGKKNWNTVGAWSR